MRWVNDVAAAALLLASGCGNYSTEDIRFLSALPHREDLHVAVPAAAAAPAAGLTGLVTTAAACNAPGEASLWLQAKGTSDGLNRGVDFIVGLIDRVRKVTPTERYEDSRRWGPFDDERHDGREIQIVIDREWPQGPGGTPTYNYVFQGRVKGSSGFSDLISGTFVGASSARGDGTVTLHFQTFWDLGVADADTPHGTMTIGYSRSSDPVTIDLDMVGLAGGGFGVPQFGYGFTGFATGDGAFDYRLVNAVSNDVLTISAAWNPAKAGRLHVLYEAAPPSTATGSFDQCWDEYGCLLYVRDPGSFSCPVGPCSFGVVESCPAVLVSPF